MQIGSSFNFPQLPQRNPAPVARPTAVEVKEPSSGSARQPLFAELIQSHQQHRQEKTEFYSADRDLSLKGQLALDAYQTTANFGFKAGSGELVGVDIYI